MLDNTLHVNSRLCHPGRLDLHASLTIHSHRSSHAEQSVHQGHSTNNQQEHILCT